MNRRTVTEQDFRMPEFKDAVIDDYEFRADGKLVRKDRWEKAIREIRCVVCDDVERDFEIDEVVAAVKRLVSMTNSLKAALAAYQDFKDSPFSE